MSLRGGVYLPMRALWCWDEYCRLSPAQKALAWRLECEMEKQTTAGSAAEEKPHG